MLRNLEAGKVFGVLILANFMIILFGQNLFCNIYIYIYIYMNCNYIIPCSTLISVNVCWTDVCNI